MSVSPEVESLIADAPVSAHVATAVDDRPHVAPVWYGYRDGVLYFLTGGRKLENLRANPRVALSIEDAHQGDVNWNVTLLGRASITEDPDRIDWASGWIFDRYENDEDDENDSESGDPSEEAADDFEEIEDDFEQTEDGQEEADDDLEDDYALVEVTIGSAACSVYD
jgi:nitroimidazol reductase NimA-like FMN-containing flavoprotein (pyridoxamine 5'-phosphate oxidase superfamily)